jgi:anti-sigma factor RsiW
MSNNHWPNWESRDAHPAEELLLYHLDGELPAKKAAAVSAHLDACWSCRLRAEQMQTAIFGFVLCRDQQRRISEAPPDADVTRFQGRIERVHTELGSQPRRSLWRNLFGRILRKGWQFSLPTRPLGWTAMIILLVAGAFLLALRLSDPPIVSAHELLQKSLEEQTQRGRAVTQPVRHQRLALRRMRAASTSEPLTIELWYDEERARFRQSVEVDGQRRFLSAVVPTATPTLLHELNESLRANEIDTQRPLSASTFARWRQSLKGYSDQVTRGHNDRGVEVLMLRTTRTNPPAIGQISEATLVVRARDWHPVEQQWQVQTADGVRGYQLIETRFVMMSLVDLNPAIFGDAAEAKLVTPTITPVPASPRPTALATVTTPTPALPVSESELTEAEVAARYALHQLKADLGEPVEIIRDANRQIIVRGLVETPARKQQLIETLRELPLVSVQIQTIAEAVQQSSSPKASSPPTATVAPVTSLSIQVAPTAVNLLRQRLEQHFNERGLERQAANVRVTQILNAAFAESTTALSEAWALRRLAERFQSQQESGWQKFSAIISRGCAPEAACCTRNWMMYSPRLVRHQVKLSAVEKLMVRPS